MGNETDREIMSAFLLLWGGGNVSFARLVHTAAVARLSIFALRMCGSSSMMYGHTAFGLVSEFVSLCCEILTVDQL